MVDTDCLALVDTDCLAHSFFFHLNIHIFTINMEGGQFIEACFCSWHSLDYENHLHLLPCIFWNVISYKTNITYLWLHVNAWGCKYHKLQLLLIGLYEQYQGMQKHKTFTTFYLYLLEVSPSLLGFNVWILEKHSTYPFY